MLHHLDDAIESFLRSAVPLASREIDVAFDPPDREWGSGINRPTVNIFLWNILRDHERSMSGQRPTVMDGAVVYAAPPVSMEFRYLITAWSARHEDEKRLLGAVLTALNSHERIPEEHLPEEFVALSAPELSLAATGAERASELWNALDGQLKPGLQLVVRCALPGPPAEPAGAPVDDFSVHFTDPSSNRSSTTRRVAGEVRTPDAAGALVRGPRGSTRVNEAGRFAIVAESGDELTIESDPPHTVTVPEAGGVVVG
jgi:Pvc16 N-terminal domain